MKVFYCYYRVILTIICGALVITKHANALLSKETMSLINQANEEGPYLGVIVPNSYEMNPLILDNPDYVPSSTADYIDIYGRRFRFASIGGKKVIVIMTGQGMINAAISTQLMFVHFNIEGILHYGVARNVNNGYGIGDVVIPQYWSHTGLWIWQRNGQGVDNQLPLNYTKDLGNLNFATYTDYWIPIFGVSNLLSNIWYQPEEIFRVDRTPEDVKHVMWAPTDKNYYKISSTLKNQTLGKCVQLLSRKKCLRRQPKVDTVARGTSASIYLDNQAYGKFLFEKFNITLVDMESAAVALLCRQQKLPFIAIRALSGLAGGNSPDGFSDDEVIRIAAANAVTVVVAFIKSLKLTHAMI